MADPINAIPLRAASQKSRVIQKMHELCGRAFSARSLAVFVPRWTRLTGGSRRRSGAPIGSYGAAGTEAGVALLIIVCALDRHLGDRPHVDSTKPAGGTAGMNVPRLNVVASGV